MSQYYKRSKNIFNPDSREPFRLSRSKIELFSNCARCFYLDRRLGIGQPPGFPFNLNSAVDHLLKKEFDVHRAYQTPHPLVQKHGVDAIPFQHDHINVWRENFKGVQYHHQSSNFLVTGAVDDVWVNSKGELMVVDYKSTSKDSEVNIDADWQISYKRQMEIYQWLLRNNGFAVSPTGYFVYCNGRRDLPSFDGRLEFEISLLPYVGDDAWIEPKLLEMRRCLSSDDIPEAHADCDYCSYRTSAGEAFRDLVSNRKK